MQTLVRPIVAVAALLVSLTNLTSQAQQPVERLYRSGETLILSGSEGPGSDYQWFKDAAIVKDGGRISGAQNPILTVAASVYDDAGYYLLLNTNITFATNTLWTTNIIYSGDFALTNITATNIVTMQVAVQTNGLYTILVQDPPQIVNFLHTTKGDDVTFEVDATGGGLKYQWYWQGQLIPGATNNVLAYTNAYSTANAGYYHVEVSNKLGTAASPPPGLLFLKPAPGGKYQGVFYDESAPAVISSGRFEFNLTSAKKAFSGKATILNQIYKFSGAFSDSHHTIVTAISKTSSTALTLRMQLLTTNSTAFVEGTVSDGNWTSPLRGHHSDFSSNAPPAGFGQSTVALMNTNYSGPGEVPNGVSIASVAMRLSGTVNMSGKMADGSPYSYSTVVSPSGEWPVYVPLNRNRGCLVGWVPGVTSDTVGKPLFWLKQPGPDTYYPNGFNLALQPLVSSYVKGGVALPLEESVASFASGDLFTPELVVWTFVKVSQPQPNELVPEKSTEKLYLSVSGSTGLISGKFTDFTTGLRTPIRAVALQNRAGALGYFLSTNSSGYFSLSENTPVE